MSAINKLNEYCFLSGLICCSVFRNNVFRPLYFDLQSCRFVILHPSSPGAGSVRFLASKRFQSTLRHPFPGAGPAQAGGAGAAAEDGRGGGGRRFGGAAVLEQNVDAAFAPFLRGQHHGRLALVVLRFHIDSILQGRDGAQNMIFKPVYRSDID